MKQSQSDHNQFALGLLLGFLAGSTSYFFLTTDKGKELRQNLKQEWRELQQQAPSVSEVKIGDLSLQELINLILGLEAKPNKNQRKKLIKEAKRPSSSSRQKKPTKFKGL